MKDQTVNFVNANAAYTLIYPAALNDLSIFQLRRLIEIMCDDWYWEQNQKAIETTKEVAQELLDDVSKQIDMGVGILSKSALKTLAAKKNRYQKILNFITEKE